MKLGVLPACPPEHENPIRGGAEARTETGLLAAHSTLRPVLVA